MKTPPFLRDLFKIPELLPSRKLSRVWQGFSGIDKKEFLSVVWTMEQSGALAQIGDPAARVDRVSHQQMSAMLQITRSTFTKRVAKFSRWGDGCRDCSPEGKHAWPCGCVCHTSDPNWGPDRRRHHSQNMRAIVKSHPRWNGATLFERDCIGKRKHSACILTRNRGFGGFGEANSYALAMPDQLRPEVRPGADHIAALARHFGKSAFDPEKAKDIDYNLSGFRKTYGWIWHPNLPDAPDCSCLRGQKKLAFQKKCAKCDGKGYVVTSPALGNGPGMPDYGRVLLHWLLDRGIDEEMRSCAKCNKTFSQPRCPECQQSGRVTKKRGELEGYTQDDIARAVDLDVSTIRRYFRAFRRLNLVRTLMGKVYRKCSRCEATYSGTCACGNTEGRVVKRDAHTIKWLPSCTLDKDIARAERERIDALVRHYRRFLEQQQQQSLEQAAELCRRVLGEWEGHEHRLESYYHEMRRRLDTRGYARFVGVLFPLHSE